jgi:hypothetical protein
LHFVYFLVEAYEEQEDIGTCARRDGRRCEDDIGAFADTETDHFAELQLVAVFNKVDLCPAALQADMCGARLEDDIGSGFYTANGDDPGGFVYRIGFGEYCAQTTLLVEVEALYQGFGCCCGNTRAHVAFAPAAGGIEVFDRSHELYQAGDDTAPLGLNEHGAKRFAQEFAGACYGAEFHTVFAGAGKGGIGCDTVAVEACFFAGEVAIRGFIEGNIADTSLQFDDTFLSCHDYIFYKCVTDDVNYRAL